MRAPNAASAYRLLTQQRHDANAPGQEAREEETARRPSLVPAVSSVSSPRDSPKIGDPPR
jgi:hypothetical protein